MTALLPFLAVIFAVGFVVGVFIGWWLWRRP